MNIDFIIANINSYHDEFSFKIIELNTSRHIGWFKYRIWMKGDMWGKSMIQFDATEIARIKIDRQYRRQGIGTKVLKFIFEIKGNPKIMWSQVSFENSKLFFEKNGFVVHEEYMNHDGDYFMSNMTTDQMNQNYIFAKNFNK